MGEKDEIALVIQHIKSFQIEEERSWADLPIGVLCEIYSRVHATDRFVFRLVCRPWKRVRALIKPTLFQNNSECHSSPFLFFQNNNLYDPVYDSCHHMDLLDKPGAIVHVAKYGWFLMTFNYKEIFFYNPITKVTVQLPKLEQPHGIRSMSFSAPPTSKGWMVIFAQTNIERQIFIYIIKDGEEDWRFWEYFPSNDSEKRFKFSHCNAVIHKESYYFLGKYGQLLIHDPRNGKFYFRKASKSISQDLKAYGGQEYMLESDGRLLAVFVNFDGSLLRTCRWDGWKKEWEILENLGNNNMLFVSAISSISEKTEVKGMGNKIYFPRFLDSHCLFYSLSTKRYHTFEGGPYADFNIQGSKRFLDSFWIKPAELFLL